MKRTRPLLGSVAILLLATAYTTPAQTSGTWTNTAGGSWGVTTNWQGGIIAGGTDATADFSTLNITANATVSLDGPRTIGSLKFGDATTASNDWTISGTDILTLDTSVGAVPINVVNRTATISSVIAGSDGIDVSGAGVLALNANNTFTGQLTIAAGSTVNIGATTALGAGGIGNETIVNPGGALNVFTVGTTQLVHSEQIRVSGTGINNAGAITSTGGGTFSTLQNITLTGATTFGGTNRFNVSGGTLDLGGFKLTKVGTGQVAITGGTVTSGDIDVTSGNLSFEAGANVKGTGTITVSSGAILGLWNNTNGAQTRAVTLNSGAILRELGSNSALSTFSSPITLAGNATLEVLPGSGSLTNLTLNGGISESGGSFGFTRNGAGKLTIAGTNTFTGALNLNAGTTVLAAGATLATNSITLGSGAVLDVSPVGGFTVTSGRSLTAGRSGTAATDITGNLVADTGSVLNVGGTGQARTLTLANDLTLNGTTITFDLGNATTPGAGVNDLIAVGGNLTVLGTNAIAVKTAGASPIAGTYTLATYAGALSGTAANLTVTAPGSTRQTFTPSTATAGTIQLVVAGNAANLTWNGTGTWDLNNTAGFTDGTVAQKFFNLDTVTFANSGTASPIVTISGDLQPAAVTVNASQDYTFTGIGNLTGTTPLLKSGTGKLTINGTGHSFTGGVNVTGGTVSVASINDNGTAGSLGNGSVTLAGGTLEYTGLTATTNRTLTLGTGGGNLAVSDPSGLLALTTSPSGSTGFTKSGPGTLLANYTGAYTGGTTIAAGTVRLLNTNALGAANSVVTVADGGTLDVNGLTPANKVNLTISGAGANGLGALRNSGVGVTNNNIGSTVTLVADASIGTNSRYDFVGGVTVNGGTFTLTKVGTGETWWGPNAGATVGNIVVSGGRLGIQSSNNLGSTAHSVIVNAGAQVSSYGVQTNAKPIVLDSGLLHNNSAAPVAGALATWNGSLTLQGASITNRIDTFGGPIAINGKITGGGGFEKLSTGTVEYGLDISAADNDYTGETQITRGTVRIQGSGRISPASALVMNGANATFNGNGTAQTVAGLRGTAGTVTNVALTVNSPNLEVFSGNVTGATTSLVKQGSGSLTLAGTGNTYTGATSIQGGSLFVTGSISGSAVQVSSDTILGGTGAVGAVSLLANGSISPGLGGYGTLSASSLLWAGTGKLLFELGSDGSSDQLSLGTGVLTKGAGSGFIFDFLGTGAPNQTYMLATFGSTTFSLADFSYTNLGGVPSGSFQLTGNSLRFVTVPEPSAALSVLTGVAGLLGLRRRRG